MGVNSWWFEALRLGALYVVALVVGLFVGYWALLFLVATLVYLGLQAYNVHRLERWLASGRRFNPPEPTGIWGEIFHQFYRMRRRDRQRKRRLAALLREVRDSTAAMPDGTIVLNHNWQILWFNNAAERILKLRVPQDVGQRIGNLVRHPDFIRYLNSSNFAVPVELPSPVASDVRLALHIVPYGADQKLLLVRDVTRIHRLKQMRRVFVANASHELRSPLTVIGGYLDAMADDQDPDSIWRQPIAKMQQQAHRMTSIVNDLLELSRLETRRREAPRENIHIAGTLARIRGEALAQGWGPSDIEVAIDSPANLLGAESEIYSAFSNLVFNAMKFTPPEGHVRVRWFLNGGGRLDVEDSGVGISAAHIPRITERFYRVDESRSRRHGGTGLGLAIVKHVLQRHEAVLEVTSEPGKGSTFSCLFPPERIKM